MSTYDTPNVTVVGAGPVGAALALGLSQLQPEKTVLLIDAASEPAAFDSSSPPDARIFAINPASQKLFERLGVWMSIIDARSQAFTQMHVCDANGTGNISFYAEELDVPYLGHLIEAQLIQTVLFSALRARPNVEILTDTVITSAESHEDHMAVEVSGGRRFVTELLCAADGSKSATRTLFQIPVKEKSMKQWALAANFYHEENHNCCAWQVFRETGPLAFLPLSDFSGKHMSSMVWSLDYAEAERVIAMNESDFTAAVAHAVEHRFGKLSLASPRFEFELVQRHAKQYVLPNFALVGDAAHSVHPLAGLGANIGYADVDVLLGELARATHRDISWGNLRILQRYQRTRRIENEAILQTMGGLKQLFGTSHPWIASIRNMGVRSVDAIPRIKREISRRAGSLPCQ